MKDIFSWYYRPSKEEFERLWSEAIFVFDTNVLLTLYRYPYELREVFFSVLGKISSRVWIPYQVGIEFHRNKFRRINQENNKVNSLIQEIDESGKLIISNVEKLTQKNINAGLKLGDLQEKIKQFRTSHLSIIDAVSEAKNNLPQNSLDDPIGIRVSDIFQGKVGKGPTTQDDLDKLLMDADQRFEKKIPPGFKDKNPKDDSHFYDGKILYKNKYGDLIMWRQTIEYMRSENKKYLIFVTDDTKTDWWDTDGHLTRGPLPALLQEMRTEAGVDLFWIYRSDQFLQYSEEYLQAHEVTEEAIEQAKGISEKSASDALDETFSAPIHRGSTHISPPDESLEFMESRDHEIRRREFQTRQVARRWENLYAEKAVEQWLRNIYSRIIYTESQFPDFVAETETGPVGIKVKTIRNFNKIPLLNRLEEAMLRGYREIMEGNLSEVVLIVAITEHSNTHLSGQYLDNIYQKMRNNRIASVIIGEIYPHGFEPIHLVGKSI